MQRTGIILSCFAAFFFFFFFSSSFFPLLIIPIMCKYCNLSHNFCNLPLYLLVKIVSCFDSLIKYKNTKQKKTFYWWGKGRIVTINISPNTFTFFTASPPHSIPDSSSSIPWIRRKEMGSQVVSKVRQYVYHNSGLCQNVIQRSRLCLVRAGHLKVINCHLISVIFQDTKQTKEVSSVSNFWHVLLKKNSNILDISRAELLTSILVCALITYIKVFPLELKKKILLNKKNRTSTFHKVLSVWLPT